MVDVVEYTYFLVRQIPFGKVSSYGAIASALGNKGYSRAVGGFMNRNPNPESMPCFKIVCSDGRLGGFGLGVDDKIRRLGLEGIEVENGHIVNFDQVFFDDFKSDYPLKKK